IPNAHLKRLASPRVSFELRGAHMKMTHKILASVAGAAVLCASALPAAAASFTQPGATLGSPAGAVPPPGLYFANSANWGLASTVPAQAGTGNTTAVGVEAPAFIWVPGWNFLGAQYAASVALVGVEVGIRSPGHVADVYNRNVFNPYVSPLTLSWNLG